MRGGVPPDGWRSAVCFPAIPGGSAIATSSDDDEKATKANAKPQQPATAPNLASGLEAPVVAAATAASVEPQPVFDRDNEVELMMAHRDDAPDRPSKKRGQELPADLEAVVMRCLRKNADDRFQNAAELADALAQCADAGRWTR